MPAGNERELNHEKLSSGGGTSSLRIILAHLTQICLKENPTLKGDS